MSSDRVTRDAAAEDESLRYEFGENWRRFVDDHFNETRLQTSQTCLLEMLQLGDLQGRTFLDVGSGSGLSSLAAFDAGAERIVSFDVDPESVATTRALRAMRGNPKNWSVLEGSILDPSFVTELPAADIVYSWGVLHHTGQMWTAIDATAQLMNPNGVLFLALYDTMKHAERWREIKRRYNRANPIVRRWMEFCFVWRFVLWPHFKCLRNPMKHFRDYEQNRGMHYITDVRDWLGGYPFEHATVQEVLRHCREQLGLELVNVLSKGWSNQYLFQQVGCEHRWPWSAASRESLPHLGTV